MWGTRAGHKFAQLSPSSGTRTSLCENFAHQTGRRVLPYVSLEIRMQASAAAIACGRKKYLGSIYCAPPIVFGEGYGDKQTEKDAEQPIR